MAAGVLPVAVLPGRVPVINTTASPRQMQVKLHVDVKLQFDSMTSRLRSRLPLWRLVIRVVARALAFAANFISSVIRDLIFRRSGWWGRISANAT
ncbi:hypothetical protein [Rhodococcus koreensis]|uniref:hypothetical protein n=1 Tax=Rhodococcus koreensis TaxID=99653 RepID=UPI00366E5FDB